MTNNNDNRSKLNYTHTNACGHDLTDNHDSLLVLRKKGAERRRIEMLMQPPFVPRFHKRGGKWISD